VSRVSWSRMAILTIIAVSVLSIAPAVGSQRLPWAVLGTPFAADPASVILWQIRLPRVFAAFVGGAGLALGGAVFQAIFRNPLATPYTLGVASGASLGVAVAMRLGILAGAGVAIGSPVAAFVGAMFSIGVVWTVSRLRPDFSSTVLLLAGVAMTFFFSSLILFLQYTATLGDSFRLVRWLMGGLGAVEWGRLGWMSASVMVGAAVVLARPRTLDLMTVGSEIAASRGVSLERSRTVLFVATSLMVAGVVAACGPIGFVGMMAPHICRILLGAHHRVLLPASAVFGGAFLVACDTVARTVMAPMELPVGIITAFLGGPFFLVLLIRRQHLGGW
jgi:iron complex transport system permease protein